MRARTRMLAAISSIVTGAGFSVPLLAQPVPQVPPPLPPPGPPEPLAGSAPVPAGSPPAPSPAGAASSALSPSPTPAAPTRLTTQQAIHLLRSSLASLRALYGVSRDEPRVDVLQRGAFGEGIEVVLTCQLPVARAAPGQAAAHGLPFSGASDHPAERALLALLLLLARIYPLPLPGAGGPSAPPTAAAAAAPLPMPLPPSGAFPYGLTAVQVPGGLVVLDLRAHPTCTITWKPQPLTMAGGQLSTQDVAALLMLFAASARCLAVGEPLPSPEAPATFPPPDIASSQAIAAAIAELQEALPLEVLGRGSSGVGTGSSSRAGQPLAAWVPPLAPLLPPPAPPQPPQAEREEEDEDLAASEGIGGTYGGGSPPGSGGGTGSGSGKDKAINPKTHPRAFLRSLGVKLYDKRSHAVAGVTWDMLAGGEGTRKAVEEAVLFPMQHPEAYQEVCARTRAHPQPNAHGAYLFVGPPGTGKTTTARIIAAASERPLVVLSFENIGSPYYAQSENNLAKVLDAVAAIPGALLFIDEAESMFPSRYFSEGGGGGSGGGVNAAVGNKLLSSLLKWLEGMEGGAQRSVILASNRAEQLDPALLSRCAGTVALELPDARQRRAILQRYALQLSEAEVGALALEMEGLAGRDILRVCEVAERQRVAAALRESAGGALGAVPAPALADYQRALRDREGGLLSSSGGRRGGGGGGGSARSPAFQQWVRRKKAAAEEAASAAGAAEEAMGGAGSEAARPAPVAGSDVAQL